MAVRPLRSCLVFAALVLPVLAGPSVQDTDRVVLAGNVPEAVNRAEPLGRPEPGLAMERMVLSLRLAPAAQAGLDALLARQQDPASPDYHRWLTPEAFGARFGASDADLAAVTGWLEDSGFTIEGIGRGRTTVVFSGDVQRVEQAFRTLILDYRLEGRTFHANAVDPSIPRALAGTVHGVVSLHNLPRTAANTGFQPLMDAGGGAHYLAPGDFATIYNVKPLYEAGTDGTGVTVAVVGRTHIALSDVTTFRSQFALPAKALQFLVNGPDPGDLGGSEDGEADLDVEWAGAVARNATVKFVISASTAATDGVDLSAAYIVDNNLAAVMTTSFGSCEAGMGAAENAFYSNLWAQAAAQGITAVVAAGDSGAAGCSSPSASSGSGQGVSGLASTPYNVCVGGTEFAEGGGAYWASTVAADQSSALGYIPEVAWNESGGVSGGSGLWATGGGPSSLYAKPSWQAAPGVPADGRRDCPDVALSAASHDGYLIQSGGGLQAAGGTSCATPAFASLMALVVQATGQRQGNANPVLYRLGAAQYKGTGAAVFHDTTQGGNTVPGTTGFTCTTGYDLCTGLGSVNAQALVADWGTGSANKVTATIAAPSAAETIASGATVAFSGTGADSSAGATLSYAWTFGDGGTATGASASHAFTNTGAASAVDTVTLTVTDATGVSATATRAITVTPAPRNTLTASITAPSASLTAASGSAVAFTGAGKDSSSAATLSYAWTFGDGATAAGASASHAFTNTGTANATFTVTLTVTDSTGVAATATRAITVTPAPRNTLAASITAPSASLTTASGSAVAFTGAAKDSSTTATLTYAWAFGDGGTAAGASVSHTFTNSGTANATCTVTLTVTDQTGVSATATRTVTVTPAPQSLTATINGPATAVASGTAVTLTGVATDSHANAGFSYSWSAGLAPDARLEAPLANTTTLSSVCSLTVTNGGATAIKVLVTFTVTDNLGATAKATCTLTVNPARP